MHQRKNVWRNDGVVENIEADQSYFTKEVNHVEKRHFYRNLANITPCNPTNFIFSPKDNAYCSLYLHPTQSFQWDRQVLGTKSQGYGGTKYIQPTGYGSECSSDRKQTKTTLEAGIKYMALKAKHDEGQLKGTGKYFNPELPDKVQDEVEGQRLDAIYDLIN